MRLLHLSRQAITHPGHMVHAWHTARAATEEVVVSLVPTYPTDTSIAIFANGRKYEGRMNRLSDGRGAVENWRQPTPHLVDI